MNFIINGKPQTLAGCTDITSLLSMLGYKNDQKIAVAVNLEFIPRSAHNRHALNDGDDIEIVAPMQGG